MTARPNLWSFQPSFIPVKKRLTYLNKIFGCCVGRCADSHWVVLIWFVSFDDSVHSRWNRVGQIEFLVFSTCELSLFCVGCGVLLEIFLSVLVSHPSLSPLCCSFVLLVQFWQGQVLCRTTRCRYRHLLSVLLEFCVGWLFSCVGHFHVSQKRPVSILPSCHIWFWGLSILPSV